MYLKIAKRHIHGLLLMACALALMTGCYKKSRPQRPRSTQVKTALIEQRDVPVYIDAIGQVIAPVTVNIRPQVAGKLIRAYIQQGAIVNEGDILYEIDPRPYQAILDENNAQLVHDQALLEYAEQTVKRYKQVVEDDYISLLSYEQYVSNAGAARAQVELDKAAVVAAKINVEFCTVVAPVAGKISYFNVDVGNILAVDDANQITVIRPFSPIDILFSLPQQQFELIRQVQGDAGEWPFVATLPEKPQQPFSGKTYFIDNQIDQDTGTILLKGRLENEQRTLWPGEFIRVKVLYKMANQALLVPPSALLMGKDGPYIYTVDSNGKAVAQNVVVLTKTEEYIALQAPQLAPGATVITDGQINVAPGLAVTIAVANKS